MGIVKEVFTLTFPSFFGWAIHECLFRLFTYLTNIFEPLLCGRHLLGTVNGEQTRHHGLHSLLVEIVIAIYKFLAILNGLTEIQRAIKACNRGS